MSLSRVALAKLAITSVCLFVAVFYWFLSSKYHTLAQARVDADTTRVFPITGLLIDLSPRMMDGPQAAPGIGRRSLVLYSSDSCIWSDRLAPVWEKLIASLPFEETDEVVAVTLDGNKIPARLSLAAAARGVRFRVLRPLDPSRFVTSYGMTSTPSTLALDEQSRIAMIVRAEFLRRSEDTLRQYFGRHEGS